MLAMEEGAAPEAAPTFIVSHRREEDVVKGPWSPEEDEILKELVAKYGARNWSLIAQGLHGRSGKSCRLRWCNQLNPEVSSPASQPLCLESPACPCTS